MFARVVMCNNSAGEKKLSRVLLQDATYVSDEEHLAFFGGRSLPVMLGCPATTLEVMPYALAGRAEDPGLCVCDLRVRMSWIICTVSVLEQCKFHEHEATMCGVSP